MGFASWFRRFIVFTFLIACYPIAWSGHAHAGSAELHWSNVGNPQVTEDLRGLVYAEDQSLFVAVGAGGTILTSTNGSSWMKQNSGVMEQFNAVTYGNGKFVAVGMNGLVAYSINGVQWVTGTIALDTPTLTSVSYGHGVFVAVGDGGNDDGRLYSLPESAFSGAGSLSLVTWTDHSAVLISTPFYDVDFDGTRFMAMGMIGATYISDNGTDWVGLTNDISDFYQGRYLEDTNQSVAIGISFGSTTGIVSLFNHNTGSSWFRESNIGLYSMAYANGKYMAVGDNGTYVEFTISYDSDDQLYVLDGVGSLLTEWKEPSVSATLRKVIFAAGKYIAVGDNGTILAYKAEVLTGLTWSAGNAAGTTKATAVPSGTLKYAVGAAGSRTKPNFGDIATDYTNVLAANTDIAVGPQQHLYVVKVDADNRILAWADIAVQDTDIKPGPTSKDITSVTTPTAITGLANGTAKNASALGLPSQVQVTLEGGTTASVDVDWDVAGSLYDESLKTAQTFPVIGQPVRLPGSITNTQNRTVTVSVTVNAEAPKDITSVTTPTAITGLANGTAKNASALSLPSQVQVTLEGGTTASVDVDWDVAGSLYDESLKTAQTFPVIGQLVRLPGSMTNTQNRTVTVSVTVNAEAPKDITSVTTPTAITGLANGTAKNASALGLPSQVQVTLEGGTTASVDVDWDVAGSLYDESLKTAQTFPVIGQLVRLPGSMTNTQNRTVTVSVTVNAAISANADLASLAVSNGVLNPAFVSTLTSYSVTVSSEVQQVTVTASVYEIGATLKVNGVMTASGQGSLPIPLSYGRNTLEVIVTAPNGQATRTYTVTIHRGLSGDSRLSQLKVNDVQLQPAFDMSQTSYRAAVDYLHANVTVAAAVYDKQSSVSVTGATYDPAKGVYAMPLQVGENTMKLIVTAQDGQSSTVYKLTVLRAPLAELLIPVVVTYAPNDSAFSVTQNVQLPQTAGGGLPVAWVSSDPAVVSAAGQVNRPASKDAIVLLTAVIISGNERAVKTWELIVRKNGTQVVGEEVSQTRTVPVRVGEGQTNVTQTDITRTRMSDGANIDSVTVDADKAQLAVTEALQTNQSVIRVVIEDMQNEPASEVLFRMPLAALSNMANQADLSVETGEASVVLSKQTLEQLKLNGANLFFRFIPIRDASEAAQVKQQAVSSPLVLQQAADRQVEEIGTPMTIETNYTQSYETKLIFPVSKLNMPADETLWAAYLNTLYVYIEHHDGEKEFKQGEIARDASGKIIGLSVTIYKFSTFSVYKMGSAPVSTETSTVTEPSPQQSSPQQPASPEEKAGTEGQGNAAAKRQPYMNGYPDGTFRPEQSMTRAEAAAMLWRLVQSAHDAATPVRTSGSSYKDVEASHWASAAIEGLRSLQLMTGTGEGMFEPDRPLTRAEFAAIAARWKGLSAKGSAASLTDIKGHWAESSIMALAQVGIVSGYEDGLFHPNAQVTRAEAAKMINRLLNRAPASAHVSKLWKDVPATHWAASDIASATEMETSE
ncbi:hypothetical protein PAESOLCIP111_03786 [Paenibacillus solanacearum]|uniref:SLH domain-containing protein n=1 Tax=Paenibacillus solanacearum TaxID=2048548 RepID=A0A916NQI7_9BACL|nr:S-layer homology domain-containing protein [Paenibacillus solanacearum]CAG7636807.1 hypothetical protein PAESOLCIP111_03786 [Paenibacillus solanacearum]